ncbi:MAG TPA: hypothetical protein VGB73_02045 [Pyrinomonadaceae bacterium]|jgi:hypothetical protein
MGNLLSTNAGVICPHNGQVSFSPIDQPSAQSISTRVRVLGQPVILAGGSLPVVGCSFFLQFGLERVPSPCVRVRFNGAARVTSQGRAVVLDDSGGTCSNAQGTEQGFSVVTATQPRVRGL